MPALAQAVTFAGACDPEIADALIAFWVMSTGPVSRSNT